MMNGFDLSNWNYNNNSDLSLFIIPDDSIDLIKDYYNLLTDRLRHQIWEASSHARIQRQVGIMTKFKRNQCLSSYRILFLYQTYLAMQIMATAAAWWRQRQLGNTGSSGNGVVAVAVAEA
jgi:hypothetical protein